MPIMRAAFLVLASGLAATSATAANRPSDMSWGKPGVPFEQYVADSSACAQQAVNLDISDTRAAQRLVAATRALQSFESTWTMRGMFPGNPAFTHRQIREAFQADRQFEAIAQLQQTTLEACLIERGYRQFRLTEAQRRELGGLEEGSAARRAYLHGLATDPSALSRQRIDTPSLVPPQG